MQGQPTGTSFVVAGYLVTWVVLVWYVWRLNRRSREVTGAIEAGAPTVRPGADAESNQRAANE